MNGTYSNCLLALLYLIIRGKVKKIVGISSEGKKRSFISHFVAINKRGDALHFKHLFPDEKNTFAPYWFYGKICGIKEKDQIKVLRASGRKIIWTTDRVNLISILLIGFVVVTSIPWLICWSFYSFYFCFNGIIDALKRAR